MPLREAAHAICAMFPDIELMARLDPSCSEADAVVTMMESIADLIEQIGPALFSGPGS